MKLIITILLLFSYNSYATQYYVSKDGSGTGTGLSEANSWSWAYYKTNWLSLLVESDDVSFNRGDIYYGTLPVASGTVGNRGTSTAYGTGANPLFTGMTELTSWTLSSGNIYYATLDVPRLNVVTLDGVIQKMGRYPNTGYLNYESNSGNTSITDNQLTGTPSWVGAEVVIRKYRWITDRHNVTAHSTTTLTYDALWDWGNNTAYNPQAGNGYFIQSHLGTLDLEGEWYYDNAANRLYVHFGAGTPSGRVLKAATIDNSITSASGTAFNDIDFEGSNISGADLTGKTYVTFNDCNFKWIAAFGAYFGGACSNIVINGGDITDCLDNGIWFAYDISLITIDGVTLTNIGMIPGAGMSGDGHGQGIFVTTYLGATSPNVIIKNCSVTNTGYIGIGFQGDNILIEKNFIDNFGSVKDDGGGIYTVMNSGETRVNRIIRNNIIINAIGAFEGVESYSYEAYGKEAGIYLDDYSNNITVENNIIAHGEWNGIMTNAGSPNTITGNLVYDFPQCIAINSYAAGAIRDEVITGNTLIAKTSTQKTLHILLSNANDDISLFGTINNNYYARPIDDNLTIGVDRTYSGGGGLTNYSLAGWQSLTGHDASSAKSLYTISDVDDFRFDYNFSASSTDVTLTGSWKDILNSTYTTPLVLGAYGGNVLMVYVAPSGTKIYITTGGKVLKTSGGKILVKP